MNTVLAAGRQPRFAAGHRAAIIGLILALAGGLAACSKPGDADAEKKEEVAVPVETAFVTVGGIDATYRGTGTLVAEDEATVNAKVGGVIEQILVEEGDRVNPGQALARLETDRLALEVARAKSTLDKLEQNFKRNASVYQRNLISKEAYEQIKFELDGARAAYDLARLTLEESVIRAPIAGTISLRSVKTGNTIQIGSPMFRITRMDSLQAELFVPERDIHKLKPSLPAKVTVDGWPDKTFTASVLRVNPVVDAATGTVKVTLAMAADQPELRPGMFGRFEILYDRREQALLVPKDAVLNEDAQHAVFRIVDGKARRQAVTLGYGDDAHEEITHGLAAGDTVVVTGQASLKDGALVAVVNDAAGKPSGTAQAPQAAAHSAAAAPAQP